MLLALASQSLSIMIALIPYVRETFRRHLSQKQAVILVEFDKLKRVSQHPYSISSSLFSPVTPCRNITLIKIYFRIILQKKILHTFFPSTDSQRLILTHYYIVWVWITNNNRIIRNTSMKFTPSSSQLWVIDCQRISSCSRYASDRIVASPPPLLFILYYAPFSSPPHVGGFSLSNSPANGCGDASKSPDVITLCILTRRLARGGCSRVYYDIIQLYFFYTFLHVTSREKNSHESEDSTAVPHGYYSYACSIFFYSVTVLSHFRVANDGTTAHIL
jgi:hypothetical protein